METWFDVPGEAYTMGPFSLSYGTLPWYQRLWWRLRRLTAPRYLLAQIPGRRQARQAEIDPNAVDGTDAIPGPFSRVVYDPGSVLGGGKE